MGKQTGEKSPTKTGFCPRTNTLDGVKIVSFYGPDSSARNCRRCISCKNGVCTSNTARDHFGYNSKEEMKLDVPPRNRAVHCKEYDIH